jgi:recombination protein RecT
MSNALTLRKENTIWIKDADGKLKEQVRQALPSDMDETKFMRALWTQVQKNPKLLECSRESLFTSVINSGQLGLYPDGRLSHLISYGKNCTLIIDYKGLVELVMRSGLVSKIHCDVVCEGEEFEVNLGEVVRHKIDYTKPRGEMYATYCIIQMKDGTSKCEIMTRDEVEKIRSSSPGKNSDPWTKHFKEMSKKSVFRRAVKWVKLSPEQHVALDISDQEFKGEAPKAPSIFEEVETVESTVIEAEEV